VTHGEATLQAALAHDERLETASGGRVRRRGHRGRLTPELEAARDRVVDTLRAAGARPPDIDTSFTGLAEKDHRALMDMLRSSGTAVLVGGLVFHQDAIDTMRATLIAHGREREGAIHIPDLRDDLDTSRKYLIPLLEYFDAQRLTVRHGDQRVLRKGVLEGADEPASDTQGGAA
jgi:selenocysteine-specific elongation factor